MSCSNKKRGKLAVETLVVLILLSAFLIIAVSIFWLIHAEMRPEVLEEYSCWLNNALRASAIVFKGALPSSCEINIVSEGVEAKELALLLRGTWWMYGRGKWDIFTNIEVVRVNVKYEFTPKKDMALNSLGDYLIHHNRGEAAKDIANTDYHYIQGGALGNTLCFDSRIGESLLAKTQYYIIFFDDRQAKGSRDKILISEDVNFGREWGKEVLTDLEKKYCKPFVVLIKG